MMDAAGSDVLTGVMRRCWIQIGFRHSLLIIVYSLFWNCLISDAKEYYRRYNIGPKYTNSILADLEENSLTASLPAHDLSTPSNVTIEKGQPAFLHCKIKNQGSHMVSWVRYTKDFNIVTIGDTVFIPDSRFALVRIPGAQDWTLRILDVKPADAGVYECQIGTTPKMGRNITLTVLVARAIIKGDPETQVGHPLNLTCSIVSSFSAPANTLIKWFHNDSTYLNYDPTARSGYHLEIYQAHSPTGMFSRLIIPSVHNYHAGKYTCSANNAESSNIFVQVHPSKQPIALRRRTGNAAPHHLFAPIIPFITWIGLLILLRIGPLA
ncbi:lachesin-like isoform X2 [Paramacrobiotus metropolitanus]|uniref:lachesin-like isoform X2 n=1 Tax=Paramacrobiotus metropolitanus TaxID=2943436 RepID=UPI002445D47A|nr:lachesin-like isoform X2 [Paramacrobiotus metropolitanus]